MKGSSANNAVQISDKSQVHPGGAAACGRRKTQSNEAERSSVKLLTLLLW